MFEMGGHGLTEVSEAVPILFVVAVRARRIWGLTATGSPDILIGARRSPVRQTWCQQRCQRQSNDSPLASRWPSGPGFGDDSLAMAMARTPRPWRPESHLKKAMALILNAPFACERVAPTGQTFFRHACCQRDVIGDVRRAVRRERAGERELKDSSGCSKSTVRFPTASLDGAP